MKKIIKWFFLKIGLRIHKITPEFRLQMDPFEMQKHLFSDDTENITIIDAGAHYGAISLQYHSIFKNARIFAFEPSKNSFQTLIHHISHSSLIKPYNIALSNYIGENTLFCFDHSANNSLYNSTDEANVIWDNHLQPSIPENVSVTTLDHFCSEKHINDIDILKIDTQGSELQILEGATQLLKAHKIKMIYLEIIVQPTYETKSSLVTIHQLLTSNGFELINFYNQSFTKNLKLRQFDAIYLLKK